MRLWVDGSLVIDAWYDQPATIHSGSRRLQSGLHRVLVEYYEHRDKASIAVWWDRGGVEPPPPPSPPPITEVVVDNTDYGFQWGGPTKSRYTARLGVNGSFYWTYNSTYYPVNYGKWTPRLPATGQYEVLAYIPREYSSSASVRYRILHNNQRHDRLVNQAYYGDQWISLGAYYFSANGRESVLVYDNTRERYNSRAIAFDALKFVRR